MTIGGGFKAVKSVWRYSAQVGPFVGVALRCAIKIFRLMSVIFVLPLVAPYFYKRVLLSLVR